MNDNKRRECESKEECAYLGVDAIHYPVKRGQRQAPYRAFLRQARRRENLSIYKFSVVTQV